jgi:alkanesulfonate monooxygenase SsuD/methylene tetrahydromethanopterin reductase-like flavin-dependent oxidoreductase (luciferase family)
VVWAALDCPSGIAAADAADLPAGSAVVLGRMAATVGGLEGFHDLTFAHPAEKLREVTTKVRALLAGERAQLDTAVAARPLRLGQPPVPELPIWLAALGERTTRVAAELGDGWIPVFVARDRLAGWAAELDQARQAAGLRTEPLTVVASPWTVVDTDAGAGMARGVAASCVAWYLSAMGDVYSRAVSDQGYGSAVQAILAANPRPSSHTGAVPAEAEVVLDQFTAYGTPDQVRDRLEGWDDAVDITMIGLPPGMPWDVIEATLRAAAP